MTTVGRHPQRRFGLLRRHRTRRGHRHAARPATAGSCSSPQVTDVRRKCVVLPFRLAASLAARPHRRVSSAGSLPMHRCSRTPRRPWLLHGAPAPLPASGPARTSGRVRRPLVPVELLLWAFRGGSASTTLSPPAAKFRTATALRRPRVLPLGAGGGSRRVGSGRLPGPVRVAAGKTPPMAAGKTHRPSRARVIAQADLILRSSSTRANSLKSRGDHAH